MSAASSYDSISWTSPLPQEAHGLSAAKRSGLRRNPVACGRCQRRKTRCIPSEFDARRQCVSCVRLGLECSFYANGRSIRPRHSKRQLKPACQPREPPTPLSAPPQDKPTANVSNPPPGALEAAVAPAISWPMGENTFAGDFQLGTECELHADVVQQEPLHSDYNQHPTYFSESLPDIHEQWWPSWEPTQSDQLAIDGFLTSSPYYGYLYSSDGSSTPY